MQKNQEKETAEDLILKNIELNKGSSYLSITFYFFMLITLILSSLSFFYITFNPTIGFEIILLAFWVTAPAVGVKFYDNIFRVYLVAISILLGILLITYNFLSISPILYLYYPGMILTIYTLVFNKRVNTLFKLNFNKDYIFLYIILACQYFYLGLDSYLSLGTYTNDSPELLMIYYGFLLFIFIITVLVQIKIANARLLMFFTSAILIIYSLIKLEQNLFRILAIIISIALILELLFDKKALKGFKVIDNETYYFYKLVYYANIVTIAILTIGVLYIYSTNFILFELFVGFGLVIFYAFCVFEVNRYSVIWKHILSILMGLIFIASIFFFETYISFTILMIPVSFLTIFGLNFEYQTKFLFNKMRLSRQENSEDDDLEDF